MSASAADAILEHMYECLESFSAPTRAWFEHAFGRPTQVQCEAWPAIRSGANVLAVAPTGSGKTLAAFLSAIDRLLDASAKPRGVRVLYISPLKALGVDVARNLQEPLDGIAAQAAASGVAVPSIRVAIRSGDTTPKERRNIASHPPDILVTTPESLYLLLTSKAGRILKTVETVIIDEVHSVAGTKRGAHLALSLERLESLTALPPQRVGLSATVEPPGEAARFIAGDRSVTIVNPGLRPDMELKVVEPLENMRDLSSGSANGQLGGNTAAHSPMASIWPAIERTVLDEILEHHTTLVFVNSRGLAERLTARLNDLYAETLLGHAKQTHYGQGSHYDSVVGSSSGLVQAHDASETIAMAHHGSVSKDRRKTIEDDLKHGSLRCVVATSSLELGIDMGSVDLVIQIAPPLSVASGLQRVGRADHRVAGVSHALFYPLTREQIIGVAAAVESMKASDIEPLAVPRNPLDILAQQTVAAAAMADLKTDDWYAAVRRSAPFAQLERSTFDSVLAMMSGTYNSEEFSAFRPALAWNKDDGIISARQGAQRLAVTSGGTIPDRGLYTVVLPENDAGKGPRRVGELDEEMVYESRVGDVITLGTSTWQIQEITRDRVIVTPAPGRSARLPFWHGEGNGRDAGFGAEQGRFIREVREGLAAPEMSEVAEAAIDAGAPRARFNGGTMRRLISDGLDGNAIANLAGLLAEQQAATAMVPNDLTLVVERCRDEEGDWRVILHSPYGRRVHEPWAMAVSNRLKERYGYDGQAYAADDGMVVRLPEGSQTISSGALFVFDPDELQRAVEMQVGDSVLFAARFRECAARSLFLPRSDPGKRAPLWQQRLRSSQLLAAAKTQRNFPLLLETARECLQDVYDLPALRRLMARIGTHAVELSDVTTQTPSPFAEHLLFGFVGSVMYQYDAPQAERNASLLSMDPQVLERLLGNTDMSSMLDPQAIDEVESELRGRSFWNTLAETDVTGRIARFAKTHGPFSADDVINDLHMDAATSVHELDAMRARGELMTGRFTPGDEGSQYLHRDVFTRIRSRSLAKARKAIKPVEPATYQAFLVDRQGAGPVGGARYDGADGLLRVIEQLEGVCLPAQVWESSVFAARVRDYQPSMLDELLFSGDVTWIGSKTGDSGGDEAGRFAFHPSDSELLCAEAVSGSEPLALPGSGTRLTLPECILEVLNTGAAYHADQLAMLSRRIWDAQNAVGQGDIDSPIDSRVDPRTGEILPASQTDTQFSEALWSLVWRGKVTNSSFAPVRSLGAGRQSRHPMVPRHHRLRRARTALPTELSGLWSAVSRQPARPERRVIALVDALLDRYGVIAPPMVDNEVIAGGFSGLYPVLKRMEETGALVRGMFITGFGAAQFANAGTVDVLRELHGHHSQSSIALDVLDPANLIGGAIPWPSTPQPSSGIKPSRRAGSLVVIVQGVPVLFAAPRSHHLVVLSDDETLVQQACSELAFRLQNGQHGSITFNDANGEALTRGNPYACFLHIAGFVSTPQGMKLYR